MSVDASRIEGAASCLHYMWSGPAIIIVTLAILITILGWYAFIGLALLIVFIPIQNKIFSRMSKYRQLATKYSDERIKKNARSYIWYPCHQVLLLGRFCFV